MIIRLSLSIICFLITAVISFAQDTTGTKSFTANDNNQKLKNDIKLLRSLNAQYATLQGKLFEYGNKDIANLSPADKVRWQGEQEIMHRMDSIRKNATGFPIILFDADTAFVIYAGVGGFNTKERADAITGKIISLAKKAEFIPDSLIVYQDGGNYDIVYKGITIIGVTPDDALWYNQSVEDAAGQIKNSIAQKVITYQKEKSTIRTIENIGLELLFIFLSWLLIKGIRLLFDKFDTITARRLKRLPRLKYFPMEGSLLEKWIFTGIHFLRGLIIAVFIFIVIPFWFSVFPGTRKWANVLLTAIYTPVKQIGEAVKDYIPNLITIIVITVIFYYIVKIAKFLKTQLELGRLVIPGFFVEWAGPTYQLFRIFSIAFWFVVTFPYLPGSESPAFKGVSVFLGFMFTFGSASSLSNVLAGLVLTYMRLFKIGDRVKIGDVVGDVVEKTNLVIRLKTAKNEEISIPNATVMSSYATNYSRHADTHRLILHTTVTISYDVPWRKVHQALIDAALRTENIDKSLPPFVHQLSLNDFCISYEINIFTKESHSKAEILSELHQNIQDVCCERGIEILSPHYISERDGNHSTIPKDYLKKD